MSKTQKFNNHSTSESFIDYYFTIDRHGQLENYFEHDNVINNTDNSWIKEWLYQTGKEF